VIEDFILCDEAKVPIEICMGLIKEFENNDSHHTKGMFGGGKINSQYKKCTEIYLEGNFAEEIFQTFGEYLISSAEKYQDKYTSCTIMDPWSICPFFKIQRYEPGEGYFAEHSENDCKENSDRVLAWMIYLNDVLDGGHTEFPNQSKKFQPRTGDLLIWPAYFTHSHRGITSLTQRKYIMTGWFTLL
jgi:hypothetical protein